VSGVASFSGLSISKAGVGYTFTLSSGALAGATTNPFTILANGTATKLTFTTQPSTSANSGAVFAQQPVVTVQDAYSNRVLDYGSTAVVLASTGGTLACTSLSVTPVSGVATFAGCKITGGGTFNLTATSGSLTAATSNSITIALPQVAVPTQVHTVPDLAGTLKVAFEGSSPSTGVVDYTCTVTSNLAANLGEVLATSRPCSSGGSIAVVGVQYKAANSVAVVVTANADGTTRRSASAAPVLGRTG